MQVIGPVVKKSLAAPVRFKSILTRFLLQAEFVRKTGDALTMAGLVIQYEFKFVISGPLHISTAKEAT